MSASPDEPKHEANDPYEPKDHFTDDVQADKPIQPVYYTPAPEPLPNNPPTPPVTSKTTTTTRRGYDRGREYDRESKDDDNITNVLLNVIAPSFLGGLGAVGLMAIGLNAPTKEVQVTSEDGTTSTTTVEKDYLPSLSMGAGSEFFLYSCIVVMLATIIGSIGVLSLMGVPTKEQRAKTWQIGIVYALLFPTAISALIQNQFLGGQQASMKTLVAEQNNGQALQTTTIQDIQAELAKAHKQLRMSTEIIAAPEMFSFPQQNLVLGNQESIAELDRLRRELENMKN
ncbi:MAG: hypothetical protein WBB82_08445 [Limnothrix sp.]